MRSGPAEVRGACVGILAAVLAIVLAVADLMHYQARAQALAEQWARDLAPVNVPIKTQSLIMQRAGFAVPDLLPIYGSSELYCCGLPYNGPVYFFHEPTGFGLYAVGQAVTADLYFAQAFAALGHGLRGKKVVISDSPWFQNPNGIGQAAYNHTFSPELALAFTFDAPISLPLREAIARRMLSYPQSVQNRPVLSLGLRLLGHGTFRALVAYELLDPLGRLEAWVAQLRDARNTFGAIASFQAKGFRKDVWLNPHPVDWRAELARADQAARLQAGSNPFGVADTVWAKCTDVEPTRECAAALNLYHAGRSNRDGAVYDYPASWVHMAETSAEWNDLQLELEVLRELGARPFAYMVPMQGAYADYTPISAPARETLYEHYAAVMAAAGVPSTTFRVHDEDRYFVGSFGHFSPRGWLYADLTLDLFWYDQLSSIRGALAAGGSVEGQLGDVRTYQPLPPAPVVCAHASDAAGAGLGVGTAPLGARPAACPGASAPRIPVGPSTNPVSPPKSAHPGAVLPAF